MHLMQAGLREIAIITTPEDQPLFQRFLGDGRRWGVSFEWIVQPSADGIAHAYILAEDFLAGAPSALALADNLFLGHGLYGHLAAARRRASGGTVFACEVTDPGRFGVVAFEGSRVTGLVEKPADPPSNCAVTGLYFLDGDAPRRARRLLPSARGELEIISLLDTYLADGTLSVEPLDPRIEWYDAGTHDSLLEASMAVQRLQKTGTLFGSPDETAMLQGWGGGKTTMGARRQFGGFSRDAAFCAAAEKDWRAATARPL